MTITSDQIKLLRNKTGAGMLSCKKALVESEGNFEKAELLLRNLGVASADKKTERATTQGFITSYIHTGGKLGLLLELNCETDFVARRIEFQNLAKTLAMELAATSLKDYLSIKDIPKEIYEREMTAISQKPEVKDLPAEQQETKIKELLEEQLGVLTTLGQPSLRDSTVTLLNLIKTHIALVGENIQVGRVSKFVLGEKEENN